MSAAIDTNSIVNDAVILLAILGKWWNDARGNKKVKDKIDDLHKEVRSPNGSTTGEAVEELKGEIHTIKAEMARIEHKVDDLIRRRKKVKWL